LERQRVSFKKISRNSGANSFERIPELDRNLRKIENKLRKGCYYDHSCRCDDSKPSDIYYKVSKIRET
jgi:hypothetical protein